MASPSSDPVERIRNQGRTDKFDSRVPTGLMMRYYHTCHRELWFHASGIEPDRESAAMVRGTYVDETAYGGTDSLHLGPIAIDLLDDGRVVEVKPSSRMETASRHQLGYYLWYLKHACNDEREGVLAYPTERKRERVTLTPDLEESIEDALREISAIISSDTLPDFEEKPFCETCAFQEFCWSGVLDGQEASEQTDADSTSNR